MRPEAVLIQSPTVDFNTLVGLCHQALGYSPAAKADASRKSLNTVERFLSCLASMRDRNAVVGIQPNLLAHVSFSVLLVAEEPDILQILECASGMQFVTTETIDRRIMLAVVTGTLEQWRDAVVSGTFYDGNCRACYSNIMALFESNGLTVWSEFKRKAMTDGYLLEHK